MLFTLNAPRAYLPLSALANKSVVCVSGIVLGPTREKLSRVKRADVRSAQSKGNKKFPMAVSARRPSRLRGIGHDSTIAITDSTLQSLRAFSETKPKLNYAEPVDWKGKSLHTQRSRRTSACDLKEGKRHHCRRRGHRNQRQVHRKGRRGPDHHLQLRTLSHDGPWLDVRPDVLWRRQRHRDGDWRIRSAAGRGGSAGDLRRSCD